MNIHVNGSKIEFQLEQETTLAEVLNSLSQWGQEQQYIFTGYSINGGEFRYGIEEESAGISALSEIQLLEATFQSTFAYAYDIVRDLQFCIHKMYRQLLLDEPLEQAADMGSWMRETLQKLLNIYHWQDLQCLETVSTLAVFLKKRQNGKLSETEKKSLITTCLNCVIQIDRCKLCGQILYLQESISKGEISADFSEKIGVLIDALRCELLSIGENIAKGNDNAAMMDLQNFMQGCTVLVSYAQFLKKQDPTSAILVPLESSLEAMTEILKRVELALQESDLVCVADSLEYEIYEHMQDLFENFFLTEKVNCHSL